MRGVSIIVACYKAGDYLREAVESVHAVAPNLPYEVIIVDDGSNDKATAIALNALHITDPKVRISEQGYNQGQSVARNKAIAMAKYDYIFPMDADDILDRNYPGYIDEAVASLEKNPESLISYCRGNLFGKRNGPFLLPSYSEKTMLTDNMIPVYGIYRRAEALEIGGYNEKLRFTEDWEIWLALHNARLLKDQKRGVNFIDSPHYLYRQHEHSNSVSSSQRMPIVDHMAALTSRAEALYDHHYGTTDPRDLAAIRLKNNSFLKATFRRIIANHPVDVASYTVDFFGRRYSSWKAETKSHKDQVFHKPH